MVPTDRETLWSELVKRSQNGDKDAYRQFLSLLHETFMGFILKKVQKKEMAEEICQEVLLGVHKSLHTFDTNRSILSWVYSIAHYKISDYWRQYEKHKDVHSYADDIAESPESHNQLARVQIKEVLNSFKKLSSAQRTFIELSKIEGHSIKEIAEKTNTSESAVKVGIHRALKALKGMFHES